jgi:hypothetical protein
MSRCVCDRTLWLLSEGEANREDRAHVASCAVCSARLRRLEEDLRHLTSVLREPPPPQVTPTRLWPTRVRWLTATAALAAMFTVVWLGFWRQPSPPTLPMEVSQESIWSFIEGVSAALFTPVDSGGFATPEQLPDLGDLQAALAGDWPCDEQVTFANMTCDDETFALLGGQ